MATLTHLDTHVLVWLHAGEEQRLSSGARRRVEEDDLAISPMTQLEIAYLHEVGRITVDPATMLGAVRSLFPVAVATDPFELLVERALALAWTRDPFDRLIVAGADVAGASLLTADRTILANAPHAVWDE